MQTHVALVALAAVDRDVLAARAREFLALRDLRDFGRIRSYLAPMVTCDVSGGFALARHAPRCEGIEAVEALLRNCDLDYEIIGSRVDDVVVQDERVVVRRTARLRHRGTSALGTVFAVHFFRFRDGLISELIEFADTAALERLNSGSPFQ